MNTMAAVRLEKVTLNIGTGIAGEKLENAKTLLEKVSGSKAVYTKAKDRNPEFKVRKGDNIGAKVTLRGKKAGEVLKRAFETVEGAIMVSSFDKYGNVSFGIKEYIDFPGMKYDPKIGMMGFDVCLTLRKPGTRISKRRIARRKLPKNQKVTTDEAKEFIKNAYGVKIEEPSTE
ncbi:MAG: 50S ribosomal protein L5 [Candidatus Micrarchaeota archaeon]